MTLENGAYKDASYRLAWTLPKLLKGAGAHIWLVALQISPERLGPP